MGKTFLVVLIALLLVSISLPVVLKSTDYGCSNILWLEKQIDNDRPHSNDISFMSFFSFVARNRWTQVPAPCFNNFVISSRKKVTFNHTSVLCRLENRKSLLVGFLCKYWNRFTVGITASLVDMHKNRKEKLLRTTELYCILPLDRIIDEVMSWILPDLFSWFINTTNYPSVYVNITSLSYVPFVPFRSPFLTLQCHI